jgi:hypothetical protein
MFLLLFAVALLGIESYAQNQISDWNVKQAEALGIPVKYVETADFGYDDLVYRRDLIKYFRAEYKMPEFVRSGNQEQDVANFNVNLKYWYQQYPQFVDVLDLRNYEQMCKYDASCYDAPPTYTKGCSEAEENAYHKRFNNWMAHHPDVPKLTGNDEASKQKHELELADFYHKYFKK